ncbi:unnamed protein product [marine sediment metagenome]|uniref:Clp R domain-containing protein n=1 Tax=marine sediment metagenome TaxID=412755 RepID=X1RLL5_9ZZZZ
MFKRYTEKAKRAIMIAQEEAINLNHDYIGTEHILIGLIKEEEGVASQVLRQLGVNVDKEILLQKYIKSPHSCCSRN